MRGEAEEDDFLFGPQVRYGTDTGYFTARMAE